MRRVKTAIGSGIVSLDVFEDFLKRDIEEVTLRYCRECTAVSCVYFSIQRNWESIKVDAQDEAQIRALLRENLYKIAIKVDREQSDEAKEMAVTQFGEGFTVARSCRHLVEIQESKSDKGKTARRLARMLGADQLICVGDYENDIPMILEADIGVAMGNAIEGVKQIANQVTASVDEDGVAKLIYGL